MPLDGRPRISMRRHTGTLMDLLPAPTVDTARHYESLGKGILELQSCTACGQVRYPLGPVCPWCHAAEYEWTPVSGSGHVHSWVRYHRSFLPTFDLFVPYVVVHVQLVEGPRISGRLIGHGDIHTGLAVHTCLEQWDDGATAICFVPARADT